MNENHKEGNKRGDKRTGFPKKEEKGGSDSSLSSFLWVLFIIVFIVAGAGIWAYVAYMAPSQEEQDQNEQSSFGEERGPLDELLQEFSSQPQSSQSSNSNQQNESNQGGQSNQSQQQT